MLLRFFLDHSFLVCWCRLQLFMTTCKAQFVFELKTMFIMQNLWSDGVMPKKYFKQSKDWKLTIREYEYTWERERKPIISSQLESSIHIPVTCRHGYTQGLARLISHCSSWTFSVTNCTVEMLFWCWLSFKDLSELCIMHCL